MGDAKRGRKPNPRTVSQIFTDAFEARDPKTSYGEIAGEVSAAIGMRITDEAIAGYHKGTVKKRPNLIVIAAIAEFYGLKATDLPADIATLCDQAREVLEALGAGGTPPGTRTRNLQSAGLAA